MSRPCSQSFACEHVFVQLPFSDVGCPLLLGGWGIFVSLHLIPEIAVSPVLSWEEGGSCDEYALFLDIRKGLLWDMACSYLLQCLGCDRCLFASQSADLLVLNLHYCCCLSISMTRGTDKIRRGHRSVA